MRRSWSRRSTAFGALHEAVVHRLEVQEELRDVLEELATEDPIGHLIERPTREVDEARAALPADAVRHRQPAQQPSPEEVGHASRRLQEVDRVPGRRRIDHDQVVRTGRVEVEEALHRDVVVTLHEAPGDVVVEPVLEDSVRRLLIGCVAQHELVPARLGVEHRGVQLAARLEARRTEHLVGHASFHVAERLEAEGVGEAAGRVDREHEDLAAGAHGRAQRGSRGDRRLPHATGAAEHHDLACREQRLQVGRPRRRTLGGAPHAPSSLARASATIRVTRSPWSRTNR